MTDTHKNRRRTSTGEHMRIIALRISGRELEKLDAYCRRRGWNRSRAIREFVSMLVD